MSYSFPFAAFAALCLTSSAAAAPDGPAPAPVGAVVSAWTQVVPGAPNPTGLTPPAIDLRVIVQTEPQPSRTDAQYCGDYAVVATDTNNQTSTHTTWVARDNQDHASFPIAVCTMLMDPSWTTASVVSATGAGNGLPVVIEDANGSTGQAVTVPGPHVIGRKNTDPAGNSELRIVTVADTGCKGKVSVPSDRNYQDCSHWQFGTIMTSAQASSPDLVLHAGDYRYFYEIGITAAPSADTWSYWLLDFHRPARGMLLAAPWAFARGNHEVCRMYGSGWFLLMGVGTDTSCVTNGTAPWQFDVAVGGIDASGAGVDPHRFVVLDTSNDNAPDLTKNFADAIGRSTQASTWWLTHIPAYTLLHYGFRDHLGDRRVRSALIRAFDAGSSPSSQLCDASRAPLPTCIPSTIIMGHQHLFQQLDFYDQGSVTGDFIWPQHYVVGHGGVRIDRDGLGASPCQFDQFDIGGGTANTSVIWSEASHGYVVWNRSSATVNTDAGWVATPHRADGSVVTLRPATSSIPTCR